MRCLITGGRVIDARNSIDEIMDLEIDRGIIKGLHKHSGKVLKQGVERIDASGKWVVPGLIDVYAHLREPGEEYKEDIESGLMAAAAGGYTTVMCTPDTMPVNDTISVTEAMLKRAAESGLCRLIPIAALSCGLKGEAITEMGELSRSDVIAVSNADEPVASARFLRTAMEYASNFNLHVITFCEDKSLAEGGMMHEGSVSVFSGLSGIPSEAEEITAARNIAIAGMTGVKLHLVKISAASTLKHIKSAKERGLKISASVTPHHLTLDHNAVKDYDVNVKVKPPIRSEHDRKELIQALKAGVIDMICTDHAPQHDLNKQYEFDYAAYGMTGFQTSVPLLLNLVRSGDLTAKDFVRVLSESPARIFGTEGGSISKGNPADVAIIDPDASWVFDEKTLKSKSSNSPFFGQTLKGEVVLTMKSGKVIYRKSN